MPTQRATVEAAIDLYVQRATPEPYWRNLMRRSIDRALEELTDPERTRFLDYLDGFGAGAALFPVKRIAEIYTLCLHESGDDSLRGRRQELAQKRMS